MCVFTYLLARPYHIHRSVAVKDVVCDAHITSDLVDEGKLVDLCLPNTQCFDLDEQDALFIDGCQVSVPADLTKLLQAYPLRTALKMLKMFVNIPDEHELCTLLRFDNVNHLCPGQNEDLFDLIALVCCLYSLHRTLRG